MELLEARVRKSAKGVRRVMNAGARIRARSLMRVIVRILLPHMLRWPSRGVFRFAQAGRGALSAGLLWPPAEGAIAGEDNITIHVRKVY